MPRQLALTIVAMLALAAPAAAGPEICKHNLAAAFASMDAARARVKSAGPGSEESCTAHRRHFLEAVKARALTAQCKSGAERDQDLGKLDGTVEDINGMIAARC